MKITIDSVEKLAALGVAASFLLLLPSSAAPASAESQLSDHLNGLSMHGAKAGYVHQNTEEANDGMLRAAAEEERVASRAKRQSSTALAQGRASSSGLLSMLSGSGLKHFAPALLIAALSAILLRGGSGSEGRSAPDAELRHTAASVAGLPRNLLPGKLVVGLLAFLVASSLAYSVKPRHGTAEEGSIKFEIDGVPVHGVLADGQTKWTVGEGWKGGRYSITYDVSGTESVKVFLTKPIEDTLGGMVRYLPDEMKKGFDEAKSTEGTVRLENVVAPDITGQLRNSNPAALQDLRQLFDASTSLIRDYLGA